MEFRAAGQKRQVEGIAVKVDEDRAGRGKIQKLPQDGCFLRGTGGKPLNIMPFFLLEEDDADQIDKVMGPGKAGGLYIQEQNVPCRKHGQTFAVWYVRYDAGNGLHVFLPSGRAGAALPPVLMIMFCENMQKNDRIYFSF